MNSEPNRPSLLLRRSGPSPDLSNIPTHHPYVSIEDEQDSTLLLQGFNEVEEVVVCGWTNSIVLNFPLLKEDLNIKSINLFGKRTDSSKTFKPELIGDAKSIKILESQTQHETHKLITPVDVVVLAKRSLHTIAKNGQVLIFGNVLVGDESGFCVLTVINNGVQTLYRQVEVGDRLLIADGSFKRCGAKYKFCFEDKLYHDVEIKVTQYNCRRVYKLLSSSPTKIPEKFTTGKRLWLPSKLNELNSSQSTATAEPNSAIETGEFFDVIGVISYLGRMERSWTYEWQLKTKKDGETKTVNNYTAYRWLELVDLAGQPMPLTVYMNQSIWGLQPLLTPGCVVIITNMSSAKTFTHAKFTSSVFSQMYVNSGVRNYFERMVGLDTKESMGLFGKMRQILERQDISWSGGGLYAQPFASELEFCTYFHTPSPPTPGRIKSRVPIMCAIHPFVTKQTQRIFFKGRIIKFRIFTDTWEPDTVEMWLSKNVPSNLHDYKTYHCRSAYIVSNNWFAFTHEFPKLDFDQIPKAMTGLRTRFNEFARNSYEKFCGSLLMPSTEDTSLKDFTIKDGPPYYTVMIIDPETLHCYTCIWKPSRHLDLKRMTEKLELAKEQPVIGMIDIFCVEGKTADGSKLEIFLQDFTTLVDLPEGANDSIDSENSEHDVTMMQELLIGPTNSKN